MKTRIGFGVLLLIALAVSVALSFPTALASVTASLGAAAFASGALFWGLAAALVLQLVAHLVRSEKHTVLLREIRPIRRSQAFRGLMIGFMFNALLPLRIGEVTRAHYVGRAVEISRAAVFATIVLERCVDLLVVGLVGVVIVALDPATLATGFSGLVVTSVCLFACTVAGLWICYRQPRWFLSAVLHATAALNERLRDRSRHIVWSFCHALRYAIRRPAVFGHYLALSVVMWAAYLGSMIAIAAALPGPSGQFARFWGLADLSYLGVTNWRGMGVFSVFEGRTSAVATPWLNAEALPVFALLAWIVLVVPSLILGAVALLHRELVQHVEDATVGPRANKLFRDVDPSVSFGHMLGSHFRGEHLGKVVSREESLGHFTVVRALKGGSHASTLLVWEDDALVVKKVTLPEHASKLESQYEWLRARAESPEIVDVVGLHRAPDFFSIDIEFREGYTSFFEHLHATSPAGAWHVLEGILDFLDADVHRPGPASERRKALDAYIRTKAVGKLHDTAAASQQIAGLMEYDEVVVNGERLLNMPRVLEEITSDEAAMADLSEFSSGPIHGDFTIDNLMVDPSTEAFMLIDPNDENAISDPVVDYAKLLQSLHSGYEFLLLHDFVTVDGERITFEERKSAHYQFLYDRVLARLQSNLSDSQFRSLLFHEAMHYCRMLPYRVAINPDSVALYYGIAVRLLNRFIEQYRSTRKTLATANGYASGRV